jgi:hypothetical protein
LRRREMFSIDLTCASLELDTASCFVSKSVASRYPPVRWPAPKRPFEYSWNSSDCKYFRAPEIASFHPSWLAMVIVYELVIYLPADTPAKYPYRAPNGFPFFIVMKFDRRSITHAVTEADIRARASS